MARKRRNNRNRRTNPKPKTRSRQAARNAAAARAMAREKARRDAVLAAQKTRDRLRGYGHTLSLRSGVKGQRPRGSKAALAAKAELMTRQERRKQKKPEQPKASLLKRVLCKEKPSSRQGGIARVLSKLNPSRFNPVKRRFHKWCDI